MGRKIAIIGTAGRDKNYPLSAKHWDFMCEIIRSEVEPEDHLISGGAAWADHVAVWAYRIGLVHSLTLHLPAPMQHARFMGDFGTSGGAANYYHEKFSIVMGGSAQGSLNQITELLLRGIPFTTQPVAKGYAAMAARNKLVADECDHLMAFTFGRGDGPADGGTKITWDMASHAARIHFSLWGL